VVALLVGAVTAGLIGVVTAHAEGSSDPAASQDAVALPSTGTITPAAVPTPTATPAAVVDPTVAVRAAVAAAGGDVAVAVYDAKSGRSYEVNDSGRFVTASVVKLSILGETLLQVQTGRVLSDADTSELAGMIENSNNDDASALWAAAGYGSSVIGYDTRIGATDTVADSAGDWGLTTTSAADQVAVMRSFAYPNTTLTDASRAYANRLLAQVESDQKWGASGGVPAAATVLNKNGWLPYGTGWVVNSVAHVTGAGKDYVVAIMSDAGATEAAGIARLQAVSASVWNAASS
jgi:beta-lactamase class A